MLSFGTMQIYIGTESPRNSNSNTINILPVSPPHCRSHCLLRLTTILHFTIDKNDLNKYANFGKWKTLESVARTQWQKIVSFSLSLSTSLLPVCVCVYKYLDKETGDNVFAKDREQMCHFHKNKPFTTSKVAIVNKWKWIRCVIYTLSMWMRTKERNKEIV